MSSFVRGGRPEHINGATAAGVQGHWPVKRGPTTNFQFLNTHATEAIELFLNTEAAALGAGDGVTVQPGFMWEGLVEIIEFWTLSTNTSSFNAVAFVRP